MTLSDYFESKINTQEQYQERKTKEEIHCFALLFANIPMLSSSLTVIFLGLQYG
jgi:hypothetical protein